MMPGAAVFSTTAEELFRRSHPCTWCACFNFIAISIILIDVQIANKLLFPLCAEWMFVVRPQFVASFLA